MSPVEKSLQSTLIEHPQDWSIRFLLIEKMLERGATEEVCALVIAAPEPPDREADLHRVVDLAGADAHDLVAAFVAKNPANGYGHQLLGSINVWRGDEQKAQQHFRVAESLGAPTETQAEAIVERDEVFPNQVPSEKKKASPLPLPELPHEKIAPSEPESELEGAIVVTAPQRGKKATAILTAVIVHLVIALIAGLVVVLPNRKDEPEIVASIAQPSKKKQVMQKKNVVKQTKRTSSSAAAAAPIAHLMRASAVAKISLPTVTKTSTGPLGIGDANFGAGGFGIGGAGMGTGETMFGSASGEGLIGSFYDLKQDRKGKPTGITGGSPAKFNAVMQKAAQAKFSASAFSQYFKAPIDLRFGILAIPTMVADEGPAAFSVEKEVQPKAWIVHYRGRVEPPQRGKWRFVGYFDDALVVFVNGKVVLDASWMPCFNEKGVREPFKGPALANGKPAVFGNWIDLNGAFQIDILVGERPGGQMGGALMAQEEGESYKKRKDGTPILPIFATGRLDDSTLKRLKAYPYEFAKEEAIFRMVGN